MPCRPTILKLYALYLDHNLIENTKQFYSQNLLIINLSYNPVGPILQSVYIRCHVNL